MFALQISNLSKTYSTQVKALNDVSFGIKKGSFFALLGPNGAGKSTLINIVCSLVKKSCGMVKIFGHDLDMETTEAKKMIGLVPQEFNFPAFEAASEILINHAGYYGIKRSKALELAEHYLTLLGLHSKINTQSRFLSGGMKRRLMIARAMMHSPSMLILDEPTAGVDIEVRYQIWNFLQQVNKDHGVTVVLTTHYLEEAERLCNNIAFITNGVIVKLGTMNEVLRSINMKRYTLEFKNRIEVLPQISNATISLDGTHTATVLLHEHASISSLIADLTHQGLEVSDIVPSSTRLESLFLQIAGKNP